jgi:hypothetical protein
MFLLASVWPGPLGAQEPEAPSDPAEQPTVDGDALRIWARDYLQELGSGVPTTEGDWDRDRELLRALYFLSVEDKGGLEEARDLLSTLQDRHGEVEEASSTLSAYAGALEVVRAKHARWPPNKLKHLSEGSGILDRLVEEHPSDQEIRYLRFASYAFLPFFLRRDEALGKDTAFLAEDLVRGIPAFPPRMWEAVVSSVLDAGQLTQNQRSSLSAALAASRTEG